MFNPIMLVTPRLPCGRGPSRKLAWRAGHNTACRGWRCHRRNETIWCRVPRLASSMTELGGGSGSGWKAPPDVERGARRVAVKLGAESAPVPRATAVDWIARVQRKTPERSHWAVAGGLVQPP